MKNKQHGGKRAGAGRPAASECRMCALLAKQLEEAQAREKRLLRQLETQQSQIGQVIQSKFETVHISGEPRESNIGSPLPLESLIDVDKHDDATFVESMQAMFHPN